MYVTNCVTTFSGKLRQLETSHVLTVTMIINLLLTVNHCVFHSVTQGINACLINASKASNEYTVQSHGTHKNTSNNISHRTVPVIWIHCNTTIVEYQYLPVFRRTQRLRRQLTGYYFTKCLENTAMCKIYKSLNNSIIHKFCSTYTGMLGHHFHIKWMKF